MQESDADNNNDDDDDYKHEARVSDVCGGENNYCDAKKNKEFSNTIFLAGKI